MVRKRNPTNTEFVLCMLPFLSPLLLTGLLGGLCEGRPVARMLCAFAVWALLVGAGCARPDNGKTTEQPIRLLATMACFVLAVLCFVNLIN